MKFLYEYRTPDNAKHNGVVCASDRDAAYVELKRRGIKPGRVVEAPGFFNKLFGKGKRWLAIGVLGVALAIAVGRVVLNAPQPSSVESAIESQTRRQIIGDVAVIEKGVRTGWVDVFPEEGERFLASFAVPGVPAGLRSTSEGEVLKSLDRRIEPEDGDSIEAKQIKAVVQGMKDELRRFLEKKGTVVEYGQRLVARQEEEIGYHNRAKTEIEQAKRAGIDQAQLLELWEKRNAELRAMGVKLVPFPGE